MCMSKSTKKCSKTRGSVIRTTAAVPANRKGSAATVTKKRKSEAAVPIGTALANATAVGATKNKIVVTRVTSENSPGRYVRTEERLYYDQTPENLRKLSKSGMSVRKIEGKR